MTVYAVFLNEPDKTVWAAVAEQWPNGRHFILTDNMAFVAPEGITTTEQVADAIGIGEGHEVLGIVFEWTAHKGFNRNSLWEWLRKVQATGEVHQLPSASPAAAPHGSGHDLSSRVAAIEANMTHLATKNDVTGLKVSFA